MNDKKIIGLIETTLNEKLKQSSSYIKYTFYELRVKYNLQENDTDRFLKLIRTKLENHNYKVYFTGARYEYKGGFQNVQVNELMIAVKEEKD